MERIDVSQSNISQHLGTLVRAGVLARRRAGAQVFYRIASERVMVLCEVVCQQRAGAREASKLQ